MYHLTKSQKQIYDLEKFAGGSIAVICGSMLVKGHKEISVLKNALNELYRLNDTLRTRIIEKNEEAIQEIASYTAQDFEIIQFDNKEELEDYANQYAKKPLNFYGKFLCKIKIVLLPESYGILVKMHHIIGDAWTLSLIGSQFCSILNDIMPENCSYITHVDREKIYLQSPRYMKDRLFFLEQFKECKEVVFLSEKSSASWKAARKTFVIDSVITKKLNTYAKAKKISVFVLFMAALAVYMNRVKMNTECFYIGTAVLNRAGAAEKNIMGMFVNTIPVLMKLNNFNSFSENLVSVKKEIFSALRHQKYNYNDILDSFRKEYGFSERLYDVTLSYQNASIVSMGEEFESRWYHNGEQTESLQIHIDDRDHEGIFRIHCDYQIEKFTESEIEDLYAHFIHLLLDATTYEDKKLYELELLSTMEKKQVLIDFNRTKTGVQQTQCVHQVLEKQAIKTPNKIAVIACDEKLTYLKLNELSNRIAHSLIEKGIGIGDIVAFAVARKSYLIAVIFGILKTGAAYLPIEPEYPQSRIDYLLSDSEAKLLITDQSVSELLENDKINNPDKVLSDENLCYCLYTSGTTGNPKGALITHKNVFNHCLSSEDNLLLVKSNQLCQSLLSIGAVVFDIFASELFTTVLNGRCLVLATEEEIRNVKKLSETAKNYSVDTLYCTPTKLMTYLIWPEFALMTKQLKLIMTAGETLLENQCREIMRCFRGTIINGYGPTETTMGVSYGEAAPGNITIGKPITNTQLYIVDKYLQPMPIGVAGELCVAGDGVGKGYLNRPELTAEKFIHNPFGKGILYRTGDFAYWREDGSIIYVGRNDDQVKVRGIRIELGEIENAVANMEGISQAVVIVRENEENRQILCAFYAGQKIDIGEIRKQIGEKLPRYMVPHIFVHMDQFPLTPGGKIDRKNLYKIDLPAVTPQVYIAPETIEEKAVSASVSSLLKVKKISMMDNFFDLGGDSLKAIELLGLLEKDGYLAEIQAVFSCTTLKELAKTLVKTKETEIHDSRIEDIPATSAQMRVYTAQNIKNDSTMYNMPYLFCVEYLDADRLERAVIKLIDRHEILRTQFENKNGIITQVVKKNVHFRLESLQNNDPVTFIRPFDLTKAPLLRIGYYDNTIMIDIHHIIADGIALSVFLSELNELYMGRRIEHVSVPYKQFAMENIDYSKSEEYWTSVYKDEFPLLEINTDKRRGKKRSFDGNILYDSVESETHNQIMKKCREINITPYVFYMSAFYILLSKFSGSEDIVVGVPVSGRQSKYLNTIGMFVNTIALRNHPKGDQTVRTFIEEVKENSVMALAHQNYPFEKLIKKLNLCMTDRNPLFDVMFAYQSESMTEVIFGDQKTELLPVPVETSKYDFTFYIIPGRSNVIVGCEYCTDLYQKKTIQRFLNGYKQILKMMLNMDRYIKDISVITKDEEKLLRIDFNNTSVNYNKDKTAHMLFEEQVLKKPDKNAVVACDGTMTYIELNGLANRIAHGLMIRGIRKGDIVAFALPRKSCLFAAMIGILKTGAAYLPIDPNYPRERMEYILKDSCAKICITEENICQIWDNDMIENPETEVTGNDICYCIYTSGSTGRPKGTLLTHGNISNYLYNDNNNVVNKIIRNEYQTVLSVTTAGFDIFVTESLLPLANGLQIIFANEEQSALQSELNKLLKRHPADVMQTTPTKMKSLIRNTSERDYLKKLKTIILGGESLDHSLVCELKHITKAHLFNIYGPTETTVWSTNTEVHASREITIGKPIANTQIYIMDKYMKLCPVGVTGELCIAGDGVGAGYLNRPDLTSEKFIDNPFGKGRMYKTGDLAYWREDGNLIYVGRNDFQVKIRGLRIELGEIENAICLAEGILQAVVIVRKAENERQIICAFYTETEPVDIEMVKKMIQDKLPRYMMPHVFRKLDEMPLTSSGKINRQKLPEIDLSDLKQDTEYMQPVGELEKKLTEILERVLEYVPVGRKDNFFDLGGDSLKAIEFVSEAHQEGIYFSLQSIFDCPTVCQLAANIEMRDKPKLKFENLNYNEIDKILGKNKIESIKPLRNTEVGNILLAGATGYLGIHILSDYLEYNEGTAYCLVRGENEADCDERLTGLLKYYFGEKYNHSKRIKVICADLQKDKFGLSVSDYDCLLAKTNMVINAAASVKHYGSYEYFYETNVETVKRLIEFCFASDAKLVHVSTLSVSGNSLVDQFDGYVSTDEKYFYESSLYIGQSLENVYSRSKFEAEYAVLEAIKNGLNAKIMRMGNLTNRFSDGMFQKNYESNAFLKRMKAILKIGIFPEYLKNIYLEFTPVDEAADAVMKIIRSFGTEQTVFHINSNKVVYIDQLRACLEKLGYDMKMVNGAYFTKALRETGGQDGTKFVFETFINDLDSDDHLVYDSNIRIKNEFTVEYLKRLGFEWKDIGLNYLEKYIKFFQGIGYLEV